MWGPFVQLLTYLPCQPCYKGLVAPVTFNKLGAWPLSTYPDKASPATSETVSIDLSHLTSAIFPNHCISQLRLRTHDNRWMKASIHSFKGITTSTWGEQKFRWKRLSTSPQEGKEKIIHCFKQEKQKQAKIRQGKETRKWEILMGSRQSWAQLWMHTQTFTPAQYGASEPQSWTISPRQFF